MNKTKLLKDIKSGLEMRMLSNKPWEKRSAWSKYWRKPTKADSKKICFGKSELKLPCAKQIDYDGTILRIFSEDGSPYLAYECRRLAR